MSIKQIKPNAITFVYDSGESYSFDLRLFQESDYETYQELVDRLSNPLKWDSIFVGYDETQLHFVNLNKVRHIYFTVADREFLKKQHDKGFKNLVMVKKVGFGVLWNPSENKESENKVRVKDIPKEK